MKYEWRKSEKSLYLPNNEPSLVQMPSMNYLIIDGEGDPNKEEFKEVVEALYSLSYGIKMMPKSGFTPDGYYDYTVYPLEGIWDMRVDENTDFLKLDKDKFIYSMMIRQPNFVNKDLVNKIIDITKEKKTNKNLDKVRFESLEEGLCIQMMHIGSFDDEPKSFGKMLEYCNQNGYKRIGHSHREIYLSDPRKTDVDSLKTVLRLKVKKS